MHRKLNGALRSGCPKFRDAADLPHPQRLLKMLFAADLSDLSLLNNSRR
jgi:hypothetical protein